ELVHEGRGRLVGERLALHHVAPVTGGVADRDEQRLPFRPSPLQSLRTPRIPVDRVRRVLEEVGARLLRQPVHRGSVGAMSQLPGGTVTFVFTDIEGSTRLLQELGDEAYGRVAGDHRRIVREAFTARDGTEIDTQGDAFFFSFPRARDAVAAA